MHAPTMRLAASPRSRCMSGILRGVTGGSSSKALHSPVMSLLTAFTYQATHPVKPKTSLLPSTRMIQSNTSCTPACLSACLPAPPACHLPPHLFLPVVTDDAPQLSLRPGVHHLVV
jgi:hypothetical protein